MVDADSLWVDSMPAAYERGLATAVFQPFAEDMARRVARLAPERVLELAAGTGVLTRQLLAEVPQAAVTATDLNEAMVQLGRQRIPGASWRQADAMTLPFADGQFDLVACQFGVMFFPDKGTAFAEARRVLDAGALFFSVWDTLPAHEFETAVVEGLRRAFPEDPPRFLESIPHGYADLDAIRADLAQGGLRCVAVDSVTLTGRAESAAQLAVGYCTGTPLRGEIEARGDLRSAIGAVRRTMESRLGRGSVTGAMKAHVVHAEAW